MLLPAQSTSMITASSGANMIDAKPPPCGPRTTLACLPGAAGRNEPSPPMGRPEAAKEPPRRCASVGAAGALGATGRGLKARVVPG